VQELRLFAVKLLQVANQLFVQPTVVGQVIRRVICNIGRTVRPTGVEGSDRDAGNPTTTGGVTTENRVMVWGGRRQVGSSTSNTSTTVIA